MTPVILSHEYPPSGSGGISEHVRKLGRALVATNPLLSVHVIANDPQVRGQTTDEGVNIHRISSWISGNNFLNWALVLNTEFVRETSSLCRASGISLLHAHDWMTVPAAVTMKIAHRVPFVITIHSTEEKRSNGIHTEYSQTIGSIESQGVREAARIIVNDAETRDEIMGVFAISSTKIEVVPPGSDDWAVQISSIYHRVVKEAIRR